MQLRLRYFYCSMLFVAFCIWKTEAGRDARAKQKTKTLKKKVNATKMVLPDHRFSTYDDDDESRLNIAVFRDYHNFIRPVPDRYSQPVKVEFGIAITLLINIDEKNQIMQTNLWLTLKWNDYRLQWDPKDYGGIDSLRVPPEKVWLPDIVLFNNADGNYEVTFRSNVLVEHTGDVMWVPPAIYKSSCRIDVEYFPFDEQTCTLIFGSWTYGSDEVQLTWYDNKEFVELQDYSYSGIWDIINVPGELIENSSKAKFQIVIRRKTLFYTVILIIPTVLMAFLSMMVFYLPAICSEKITLSISILLALVVFLLLVSKILPPTSDTVPLMAKYLLLTFIMNILTILVTVTIINVYYRSPTTHKMPKWVKSVFLEFLPTVLIMKRPEKIPIFNGYFVEDYSVSEIFDASLVMPSLTATMLPFLQATMMAQTASKPAQPPRQPDVHPTNRWSATKRKLFQSQTTPTDSKSSPKHHQNCPLGQQSSSSDKQAATQKMTNMSEVVNQMTAKKEPERISEEMKATIESIAVIADHYKKEVTQKKVRDDWKYISMVIDRLLLATFFGITLGGTISIIFSAPYVFDFIDQDAVIRRLIAEHAEQKARLAAQNLMLWD